MPLITAKQVSVELSISLARVYELTRRGQIPVVRLGEKQLRFDQDVLREWTKRGGAIDHNNDMTKVELR
jgi:excisionase family DNA binding protein